MSVRFPMFLLFAALGGAVSPASGARLPAEIDLGNPVSARTVRLLGDDPEERSGSAIASGDLNGDGFEDLIIGAPSALNGRGVVHIVFGSANFAAKDSIDLSAAPAGTLRILGKSALDWSGYSVAS
ncbi:MAG: FG-GAP repeat protein, partial [Candidatus Latescibacterota bacterium]